MKDKHFNKIPLSFFISFVMFFLFFTSVSAESLITIKKDGSLLVNVLSAQDQLALSIPSRSDLSVNISSSAEEMQNTKVSLFKEDNNVRLAFETDSGKSNLDVTNYTSDLIEIEETPERQKLKISLNGENFQIEQENIKITTKYPIEVDPQTKKISLKTESGNKYLSIMPKEAVEIALRSKLFDSLDLNQSNELIENNGILVYKLTGEKKINLFNVSDYKTNITGHINASNGEIVFTNEAVWVKLLSFFLK